MVFSRNRSHGVRSNISVSEGDVTISRRSGGKILDGNAKFVETDSDKVNDVIRRADNKIKQETEAAKRNMSKEWLHSKPAPVVGQAPKVEQKVTQVAEEVVAHKPVSPTMEQIAKGGTENTKKVTKGLSKWGKHGLVAAGTAATAGLIYGSKKLYDKKKIKNTKS